MFVDANGKEFESIRGRKATVINDSFENFEDGEKVIFLENRSVPYCISVEKYIEGKNDTENYDSDLYFPMRETDELIIEGDEE